MMSKIVGNAMDEPERSLPRYCWRKPALHNDSRGVQGDDINTTSNAELTVAFRLVTESVQAMVYMKTLRRLHSWKECTSSTLQLKDGAHAEEKNASRKQSSEHGCACQTQVCQRAWRRGQAQHASMDSLRSNLAAGTH